MDQLSFVEAVYRLSESIVIGIADTADRWFDASFGQTLSVSNGQILPTTIRVMNQSALLNRPSIMQRLLKSIENKVRFGGSRDPPPHDAISKRIDDEGHIDKALPCRHVSKVADYYPAVDTQYR